jgi:malonate transporter
VLDSLAIVLPVFGLIAIGYAARQVELVTDRAGDGLSEFVFTLAVPALIFATLARASLPDSQPWGYWIAYFAGVTVVWGLAQLVARRLFGQSRTAAVVAGFAAGQANTVFVGVPMILKAYGEEGAVPLALLIAVHLPVTLLAATVLTEGRQVSPLQILRKLATHPILVGIALGLVARMTAAPIPRPVWQILDLLTSAAVPCALVALGVALRRYGLEAGWHLPAIISALKLVVHPLVVYVLATQVFAMPRAWAGVAVLFAACPSGVNAYLFAQRYDEGVGLASSTIALSTALAIVTTLLWLQVLGAG